MSANPNLLIQRIGDVTVVNLEDSRLLEAHKLDALGQELYRLVDEMDRKKLIIDCTKLRFLSSAALSVFINLQKKVTAIKGSLVICGLRKEIMQVFEITKLTKLFKFAADEKTALQSMGVLVS